MRSPERIIFFEPSLIHNLSHERGEQGKGEKVDRCNLADGCGRGAGITDDEGNEGRDKAHAEGKEKHGKEDGQKAGIKVVDKFQ